MRERESFRYTLHRAVHLLPQRVLHPPPAGPIFGRARPMSLSRIDHNTLAEGGRERERERERRGQVLVDS